MQKHQDIFINKIKKLQQKHILYGRLNAFFIQICHTQALREKEKGDWNKLTIEEKKKLYRASFCQTLVEIEAPTGEWKAIMGWVMFWISVSLMSFVGIRKFCKYCNYYYLEMIIINYTFFSSIIYNLQ